MKKYAKLLALLLALAMVFGMLAGCAKDNTTPNTDTNKPSTGNNDSANDNQGSSDDNTGDNTSDDAQDPVEEEVSYTYNTALSEFPTNWNYHTYQTATDAEILDVITGGFYSFDYNETMDGYAMVPSMATGDPVDVTADYIGQYGLEEGAKNRAYVITLREDIKWEDGTPITAHDIVESAKRLLNPAAQNYRADTMYSGSVKIHNAEAYLKQGQTVKQDNSATAAYVLADLVKAEDGTYTTAAGGKVYAAIGYPISWTSGNSLADYVNAYGDAYFGMDTWEELYAMVDEEGLIPLTDDVLALLTPVVTGNPAWGETEAELPNYLVYEETFPEMAWDEVGWFALSDYELVFVMDAELTGFYLKYNLMCPLVNIELYDSCESIVDGVYTNTYGTSVETTISYGPFKLVSFQADKQYVLEKNEYFYGLTEDTYQVTDWVVDCVPEASTRLELFLQGKLDSFGLTIDYMDEYQLSDYTYYATGDSTFAMCFDPDMDALVSAQAAAGENINKTIITVPEFRMAMSFALDRNAFCLATSPTNAPGFGLYSGLIVSDPEAGTTYRSTDVAKDVLAKFWGVSEEYGPGKLYADIDEAVESITGYNLTKAQEKFNEAYDIAIAEGLMDEDDVVEIKIGTPNNTSSFYNNGYEYLVNNYTEAVKGTKLEGKLQFTRDDTLGNGFSDALKNNQVDMLFGVGWTGSALDPYGLMEAYVKSSYQYDESTDYTTINCAIEIDGVEYTTSVWNWYCIMNGEPTEITSTDGSSTITYSCGVADNDPETRLEILGALEGAVLLNYNFIPIMDDASAQMRGQQIEYYTEEYIFGMGFGGLKYYTFNYTDAEWDAYVAENGGQLDYT